MSERASQTAQRYVDAMNIASAKIEQLQAEVAALRARNETLIATIQRQDSTFERQMEEHEELEALRAQVQRVRDACVSSHVDDKGKKVVFLDRIQRALDGAE